MKLNNKVALFDMFTNRQRRRKILDLDLGHSQNVLVPKPNCTTPNNLW